ncbi:MAG: hypothetical protein HY908_00550, partial [Myxococcales bacterium]|nr:hypothetical protein [Myxococcales bacterium]
MKLRLHLAPWSGAAAAALLIASGAGTARADELACALYGVGCPRAALELGEPADGGADLGVGLTVRRSETRTDVGAGVFVGVPLWRWLGDVPGPARAAEPDPTRDAPGADDGDPASARDEPPADAARD